MARSQGCCSFTMPSGLSINDPSSWSNPDEIHIKHLHLKLNVDFENTLIHGYVEYNIFQRYSDDYDATSFESSETLVVNCDAPFVELDSKDLNILEVVDVKDGRGLEYEVGIPVKRFGSKLSIKIPKIPESESMKIGITYVTSKDASAIQWLSPEQTAGKKYPYMFTQCQAIHARSLLPCQDTPSAKFTYSAEVTVPEDLTVLMGALREVKVVTKDGKKTYFFSQPVLIPSYLVAMAVGKLESCPIGPRTCVWSEKEFIDKAAKEFVQTEEFLKIAEQLCGPYVWGLYDLLVLPPSFPFGGMENPCLTFITPTLLAGDKSLADVVAHEISHSWTGNLVTNCTFEHFWLNEGFTVFIERKILGHIFGQPMRHFHALNGLNDLKYTVDMLGHDNPITKLIVDLQGVDPDDAFSTVPYEKGHTFLFHLETLVGGSEKFDPFLRSYISKFKFKSVNTDQFKEYFMKYFQCENAISGIDWNLWLHTPGMPPVIPNYDSSLFNACEELASRWIKWDQNSQSAFTGEEFTSLSAKQKEGFLNCLLDVDPLPVEKLQIMQSLYKLNVIENCEIYVRWLRLCIKGRWSEQVNLCLQFVTQQGRMKYVRPIYRDLYAWEEVREQAVENFRAHLPEMMYVTAHTVANDLHMEV